jgi:5-dehydro-2-deoxygluconokinase
MSAGEWRALDGLIAERDPYCRGVVILGLNASAEQLARDFREAAASTSCRGFAVGRTIFLEPSRAWLAGEIDDKELKRDVRERFQALIGVWREARAVSTSIREAAA